MTELERQEDSALSRRTPREEDPPELGPEDDVPMSFFDHLSELRQCLARASLGVLVGFGVSFLSVVMFFLGGVFAYEVVLPFALRWLLDYTDLGFLGTFLTERDLNPMGQLQYQLELSKYVRGSTRILLAFATVFEMPLVVAALAKMQVLSHRTLLKFWRVAIVLIFILAAFLTPPEPVTQFMMALPMVILFFTSVLVAFILNPAGRVSSTDEPLDDDSELPAET